MKPLVLVIATALGLAGLLAAGEAQALGCLDLGGQEIGGECVIDNTVTRSGAYDLDKTLRITSTGRIDVPHAAGGNTLTLNICLAGGVCDLVMEIGAVISGDVTSGSGARFGARITVNASNDIIMLGNGTSGARISSIQTSGGCGNSKAGDVNLTAGFDVIQEAGAAIVVDAKCPAGAVTIIAAQGSIRLDGLVSSISQLSGTGTTQRPGGGPITAIARCDLTVNGHLISQGGDPGADLIHLEGGCSVLITGLVESIGPGHGPPNNPPNHCNSANRPDKPALSSACIEVWAGDSLTITSTAQLNADTGNGGNAGLSWIDLFARGPILITGPAIAPFAVHANGIGGSGGDGEEGGIVTVKSTAGTVTASGLALQAAATKANTNADGGQITVHAAGNVTLDTATLDASGGAGGVGDTGGAIDVRSFQGALSWQNGAGDVRPNATGTIALEACGVPIATAGTNFNGEAPALTAPSCAVAAPTLPSYVVLPECLCGVLPGDGECPEDPNHLITRVVDPTGAAHGVLPVHLTLQAAVNGATSGETIGVFGTTEENVQIPTKRLKITQCTVAKVKALDLGLPVIRISSGEQIIVIGLDTENGAVGWQLDSNGHELRGVRAVGHDQFGIWVKGNKNRVSWNAIRRSGVGLQVDGATNDLRGGNVVNNTGAGVVFGPSSTGNKIQGATIKQNGGDGITVQGTFNTVNSNKLDLNGGSGVRVTGASNIVKGNTAGTGPGLGNALGGFSVEAAGTTLDSNKASANGQDGFDVRGGTDPFPNLLKGNQSNLGGSNLDRENAGPEYRLLGTIQNKGGNKADGIGVPKLTKCLTFPKSGITALVAEVTCE